ncbi:MAG: gamma-glutamyltranspeptidase / glutathione hydrolase [Solirubrobacteraceae bacterium]|nr:gamma-glutamyltranspeptidase / glutathione hydrolase [Solirubrobacteraceae bacterium]
MSAHPHGIVAAGHPLTAQAGADALRAGGNAVDAAVAAMLTSWVAEPLLSGPGAGGYMLVAGAGEEPVLLDFFVAAPGYGADRRTRAPLVPVEVDFSGDARQVFHVGASSCGTYGTPAGVDAAMRRWGSMALAELAGPAAALARDGVVLNAQQAEVVHLLEAILRSTPEAQAAYALDGPLLCEGELFRSRELGDTIERLGAEGCEPFYRGDVADAVVACVAASGGVLTSEDLCRYVAIERAPLDVRYRGRDVLTNPPPSAGGILLALSMRQLDQAPAPPPTALIVRAMEEAQSARTPAFVEGLDDAGFAARLLGSRMGSTTHISVVDGDGRACSVTCTNGEGSGVVVPGTGIHVNNIMGEADLNPLGFHRAPPGRRMPSMMSPTVVTERGEVQLALGSSGSNRIRSALLQTIVAVVDHGMTAAEAVAAPRVHFENDVVYAEPGAALDGLRYDPYVVQHFRAPNMFFGGVQAICRDCHSGALDGAGDPRRGGVAVAG